MNREEQEDELTDIFAPERTQGEERSTSLRRKILRKSRTVTGSKDVSTFVVVRWFSVVFALLTVLFVWSGNNEDSGKSDSANTGDQNKKGS